MKKVNLSDSEWFIMNALWNKPGLELKEIANSVEADTGWNSGRIRTMLLRLMDKEAVSVDKTTGIHKYFPVIEREGCLKEESKSFLKRIYSGSISEFIASFAKSGEISPKEQQKILEIIASINKNENHE